MTDSPFSIFLPFSDSLDVRFFTKEDRIQTDSDLAKKLESDNIASLRQVHGNTVIALNEATSRTIEADALITNIPDLWLSIRAADCQQFVIYAPTHNVIGLIHSGWKGLKAGIIPAFFKKLHDEWGIDPKDTYVAIGPSLCTQCAEFTDPLMELSGLDPQFFHGRHADLRGIADRQLDEAGTSALKRERSPDCTRCMNDRYWSYRGGDKEKVQEGWTNVMAVRLKM
jgi:polyphenol oxidase